MKIMIATDIHGSKYYADKIVQLFNEEQAEKLVLLGDLYYHGPRNPLTKNYAPMEVATLFNKMADKIEVVKGNCDSEVDEMVSNFKFQPFVTMDIDGRKIFFTHGHKYNKDNLPVLSKGDVLVYGHFHINAINEIKGITAINLSSVSLPKENAEPAYAILTEKGISIRNLNKTEIMSKKF